ncbi:hypothetical protein [Streptomyces sp. CAU 1734]|uniref:hypothetical protein n=1 Tax=Streptomyces sp. CAU 1734 TaxID=3140360 RepID=UPI0032603960
MLSLRTGTWWILDGALARIWDAVTAGTDPASLAAELTVPGGDVAATREAVASAVGQLQAAGLLAGAPRGVPQARRAVWWRWRAWRV